MASKKLNYVIYGTVVTTILSTLGVSIGNLVETLKKKNEEPLPLPLPPKDNPLNLQSPKQIESGALKYEGYKDVVNLFKSIIDTKANPCEDFYQYTCGNVQGDMSFVNSDYDNFHNMIEQFKNRSYIDKAPEPVKMMSRYYEKCVAARTNWNELTKDAKVVMAAIKRLAEGNGDYPDTKYPFYMLHQDVQVGETLNPDGLAFLLGNTIGMDGMASLIQAMVDLNWKDHSGEDGNKFFLDQPDTLVPYKYHIRAWDTAKQSMMENLKSIMDRIANSQEITLNKDKLNSDLNEVLEFDHVLATEYSTDDTTRRSFERSFNTMTLKELQGRYDKINWKLFISEVTQLAPDAREKLLASDTYRYVVSEPGVLQLLNDELYNTGDSATRTLVNYIYIKMVKAYSDYLPSTTVTNTIDSEPLRLGRPRHIRKETKHFKRMQISESEQAEMSCAEETMWNMPYANGRLFIDKAYPTEQSRNELHEKVGEMYSGIFVGFRSMINQLKWMSTASKAAAFKKIDSLVKNIGYPDWITDDEQLTSAHKDLSLKEDHDYFQMVENIRKWHIKETWNSLFNVSVDRIDFNGPPGTTNAWYQPQLNSITLPAAILHRPFYNPSWPAAVNFGGLGVIVGHELTHGFDDEGVQWDGTGLLAGWMDNTSITGFREMADCVVDQFNHFCPLNETTVGRKVCVDGAMTQGENIADSGGIQSSYRAFRNFVNLNGPDPQLPDDELQEFSQDQLFFLGFSQVWCRKPLAASNLLNQLLTDVHSPAEYRVFGTMQNFPAFKEAFHCPTTAYAPEKHCDVWVSEMDSSYGKPEVKNEVNVRPNERITPTRAEEYDAYKIAIDFYQESVNASADPCEDFFQYACGKYDKAVSFSLARAKILEHIGDKLYDPDYNSKIQESEALKKAKMFTDACVKATWNSSTSEEILVTKNYLKPRVEQLKNYLGSDFTLIYGGEVGALPDPKQLANALGYLSFNQGIDTLITPMVDTNWPEPTSGYYMFLDQNTAYMGKTYYDKDAFKTIKENYIKTATAVVTRFAKAQGISKDPNELKDGIRNLIEFEQQIVLDYSTNDEIRRFYNRSWNPKSIAELADYKFVDWKTYFEQVPNVAHEVIGKEGFKISVMEPQMYKKFSNEYNNLDKTKLVNYLFVRLILSNAQYLPSYANDFKDMPEEALVLGRRRPYPLPYFRFKRSDEKPEIVAGCVGVANQLMQYAVGRVYIDYEYPSEEKKKLIREKVGGMMKNVIYAFQGMINSLDWMTPVTKEKAYEKTLGIVQNIAFPDWIMENAKLDDYYTELNLTNLENYYDMWAELIKFNIHLQYKQLTFKAADRRDFLSQPGTVNAWYSPELNSITFPAGILQPPYFHPYWPTSINYGALGVVAGHELTHGFDDQGVQWDSRGPLHMDACRYCLGWMDMPSTMGFAGMAECVINEYGDFCPLDPSKYTPNCLNGQLTQGENIADNGGIHAAYRAYRDYMELNGPEPLLPDRFYEQFTHDQLFFLGFAQVWCEKRRTDDLLYQQLMVDVHSPAMYRVFGTLQNFPAFRVAFNCPAKCRYAPKNHCNVWVPNKAH